MLGRFKSLPPCKQRPDLLLNCFFLGKVCDLVAALHQLLDLLLNSLSLRLRLLRLPHIVLIVNNGDLATATDCGTPIHVLP